MGSPITSKKDTTDIENMRTKSGVLTILMVLVHTSTGCAPLPRSTSADCRCGLSQDSGHGHRVFGGVSVEKNEFPWLVALVRDREIKPDCGGTLLSSRTVLTAAHCNKNADFKDMFVHVGEHDTTKPDGEQIFEVADYIIHPKYNGYIDKDHRDCDFAILHLKGDVSFSQQVMPACLPDIYTNYDSRVATVAGWGMMRSGSQPDIPHKVDVKTINNTACSSLEMFYTPEDITENMICATLPGKDSCTGDSGGSLITKEDGAYYSVIGVVSWGPDYCASHDSPGVYARVSQQREWIEENTIGSTCSKPGN